MRVDNGAGNENNAVCQARNTACHSLPLAMPGVFDGAEVDREALFKMYLCVSLHMLSSDSLRSLQAKRF